MKSSMEGKIAKNMERQLAWCTYVCVCVNEIFCSDFSIELSFLHSAASPSLCCQSSLSAVGHLAVN